MTWNNDRPEPEPMTDPAGAPENQPTPEPIVERDDRPSTDPPTSSARAIFRWRLRHLSSHVNRNRQSLCIVCGHTQPNRGFRPEVDANGVRWYECEGGCWGPDGLGTPNPKRTNGPVTCVELRPGAFDESAVDVSVLTPGDFLCPETHESDETDEPEDGDVDSSPDAEGSVVNTGRVELRSRSMPKPRGGLPPRRR